MKKAMTLILSALMLVCVLSGCVKNDVGVKLNKDGTGSISATVAINQDFYDMLCDGGNDPFEGKTTTTVTYGEDVYISYSEVTEYASYEEMKDALLALEYETELLDAAEGNTDEPEPIDPSEYTLYQPETDESDSHIFKSVEIEKNSGLFYSTYSFKATLNPQKNTSAEYNLNEVFKLTITVEMPSDISQVKGGTVDGNKATFDITDITEDNDIAATSEANNYGVVIGIIVVLAAILVAFIFFVKKKG